MAETGWIYQKYFGQPYSLGGLGGFGVDYVFAGAEVIYSANVESSRLKVGSQGETYDACAGFPFGTCPDVKDWFAKHSQVWAQAANEGTILQHSENDSNGNLSFKIRSDIDRNSINDIKSDMDSYVQGAGFNLRASQAYFTTNPRRDGNTQPPVNTPGVDPRYTQKPPQSLTDTFHNLDTVLGNAASALGLTGTGGKTKLIIIGVAAAFLLLRR